MDIGLPKDHSDFNTLRRNIFGPGVKAENIDAKEFTTGGKIIENQFDGSDIKGKNSAIAWVDLKGNHWVAEGNSGHGCIRNGQGFRILKMTRGWGRGNRLNDNKCNGMKKGSYCIFIQESAKGTVVGCGNINRGARSLCNCNSRARCGRSAVLYGEEEPVVVYPDPVFDNQTYVEVRPLWD